MTDGRALAIVALAIAVAGGCLAWRWASAPTTNGVTGGTPGSDRISASAKTAAKIQLVHQQKFEQVARNKAQRLEERAHAIQQLGVAMARSSSPTLITCLSDEKALIRGRAGAALQRILGTDFGFRALDPPERRSIAIGAIKQYWETHREAPRLARLEVGR